ncbi:hypothetical protein [Sodalis sp. (in: enterobacteria)]|uniref:hypothetical protein n=1 Tax=Sodalis sp. (in: enterobacteria) TaxID=1898979 RepID=UPI003F2DAD13
MLLHTGCAWGKQLGDMAILKPSLTGKLVSKRLRACAVVQEVMNNNLYNKLIKLLNYFIYAFVFICYLFLQQFPLGKVLYSLGSLTFFTVNQQGVRLITFPAFTGQ